MVDKYNKSDLDFLDFHEDKTINELIKGERVYFSEKLYKTNRFGFSQERNIMITNKGVYNLKKKTLKRKIDLNSIRGITVSKITDEFVVHGNREEYDYEYSTPKRKKLIEILAKLYYEETKKELKICEIEKKSLKDYVTSKKEKKKDPDFTRMPDNCTVSLHYFLYGVESEKVFLQRKTAKVFKISDAETVKVLKAELKNHQVSDFKKIKLIGSNVYTKVYIVEHASTKDQYFLKEISKIKLLERNLIDCALNEKKIMGQMDHQNLMKSILNYQDEENIYTFCPFMRGGDLLSELKKNGSFDEERVKFYAWQIIFILEEVHSFGYVLRDIKPENILVDDEGYLKLFDFSLTKHLKGSDLNQTLIGTPEYLSPEQVNGIPYDKSIDFWNLGILIYEMLYGSPPFNGENSSVLYNLIRLAEVKFPKKIQVSSDVEDLILNLLEKNPKHRLGYRKGIEELKNHAFFKSVDANVIKSRKYFASFCPDISDANRLLYYQDVELDDSKEPELNSARKALLTASQNKFAEFTTD